MCEIFKFCFYANFTMFFCISIVFHYLTTGFRHLNDKVNFLKIKQKNTACEKRFLPFHRQYVSFISVRQVSYTFFLYNMTGNNVQSPS